jgi:hypothetical protein
MGLHNHEKREDDALTKRKKNYANETHAKNAIN